MAYEVQLGFGHGSGDDDPSSTSFDYQAQIAFWNMVEAILGGEPAIKAAATTYLAKFAKESDDVYKYRLAAAPFTGVYSDISKSLASKPFAKETTLKENSPSQFVKLAENIDGQGNNLHVFAASAFKSALDKGISWILVDYTKDDAAANGRVLSIAEVNRLGRKPYWVHIATEQMLAVYSEFVDGVEVIHHARVKEDSKEVNGFVEKTVERVRVFNREKTDAGYAPATWALWQKNTEVGKATWIKIDEGPITIGIIPLVPIVLTKRRSGCWIVEPALRDIAYAQITEYRQEANLEWIKIMTCFPMVCVSGMDTKDSAGTEIEIKIGPNTIFLIPQNSAGTGPAGDVKIVEPSSQSIVENRTQLELTRKEMRDLGMQPLAQANLTVVVGANISRKASSAVQAWAFLFKDALELAWKYTAMWLGDKAFEPEVIIHTDFAIELESGKELESLFKAESTGIISKKTVRAELKRRAVVSNDVSEEDEEQRLAEQGEPPEPEEVIDPRTGRLIVARSPLIAA